MRYSGYVETDKLRMLQKELKLYPSIRFDGNPSTPHGKKSFISLSGHVSDFNKLFSNSSFFEEPNDF